MKFDIKNTVLNHKLLRSAGIYTLTSILNGAIPFLLLPILTRFLTPKDYGLVSMFGVLVSFISPFVGLNINGAISRIYFEKETVNIKIYISNCLNILICSTLVVSILFYFMSTLISEITSIPVKMLWIVVIISFTQFVTNIVLTLWQVQTKPIQYGMFQISQTSLNLFFSVLFIVVYGMGWKGSIYAQIITYIFFTVVGIRILIKNDWLKFTINFNYIKHALKFGIPLVPHALGGVILTMTDRIFITNMVGVDATGIYTVGYQIGMIINILATSFNQAYIPWLFAKLKENNFLSKIKIVKLTYSYFIAIIFMSLLLSFISPHFLKLIIGKEFSQSSSYIIWIALGYAFKGMYLMVTNYIFYAQKTSYLAGVTIFSSILNIFLNYFFIKSFGSIGAAQATTVVYLVMFMLTWLVSSKVYKMPWSLKQV